MRQPARRERRPEAVGQSIEKVLAKPEYQKIYRSDNLIPAYRNQKESRELTAEVAKDVAASLRELGIIK